MKTQTKILIGIGAALATAGIGFGIYSFSQRGKSTPQTGGSTDTNTGRNLSSKIQVGDQIYPSSGSVNIRDEARVDDVYPTTLIKKGHTGLIGTVLSSEIGKEDNLTWYKVKLATPIGGYTSYGFPKTFTEGYVRSDVVKKG